MTSPPLAVVLTIQQTIDKPSDAIRGLITDKRFNLSRVRRQSPQIEIQPPHQSSV